MSFFDYFRRGRKPASVEALRSGAPDPVFVGAFLVHSFVDSHFGLSAADLSALAAPLRDSVRNLGGFWITVYLCWILRAKIRAKYGDAFFEAAFEAASTRLALGGPDTAGLAKALNYWFQQLDRASANLGQIVEGIPLPMEFFAALAFLALTPESPFFMQSELPPGLDLELGTVLARAKTPEVLRLIELVGEVGGPLKAGIV
jgi:hypothetical protein